MKNFTVFMFVFCVFAFCAGGYIQNIYKFASSDFEAPYTSEILRGVGIVPVAPLGVVLGWMDVGDE